MPENIRRARNNAIIISFFELICCFTSFAFYEEQRSRLILVLIVVSFLATALGFYAKLRLSYWGLVCHSLFTISFIGGFYIYIIIDLAMTHNRQSAVGSDTSRLSDTTVLILASLPFLGLFIMGCYSFAICFMIESEMDFRKQDLIEQAVGYAEEQQNQIDKAESILQGSRIDEVDMGTSLAGKSHVIEILDFDEKNRDRDECVICLNGPKNTAFYPCGHQCFCNQCASMFKQQAKHQICPICRNRIQDILKIYK